MFRPRAFTLLEVLITLSIIALFSGFFLLRFDDDRAGEVLSGVSQELKATAILAKNRSHSFRRDQYIVFDRAGFRLSERVPRPGAEGVKSGESESGSDFDFPADLKVEVMPMSGTNWLPLRQYVWHFRSSGLNEPVSFRFSVGQSYTQLRFHALTARAEEETTIVP